METKNNHCNCGSGISKSSDSKKGFQHVKMRYKKSRRPSGSRGKSLSASRAMFLLGGALTLLAALLDKLYSQSSLAYQTEASSLPGLIRPLTTNTIADSMFILTVPIAVLFLVRQNILLRQIRKSIAVER